MVVLERAPESSLDCKEIKPGDSKDQPWIFIGRTDVEVETPILWPSDMKSWLVRKDPDAGKDWRQEERGTTEDEMVGWHHQLSGHEFKQNLGDTDGQGSLVCCSSWVTKSRTRLSDWTTAIHMWDHTAFVFLLHFTQHNVLKVHSSYYLWQNNKILYVMAKSYSILCAYTCIWHVFFIHLPTDGYWGYSHILNIAMLRWTRECRYLFVLAFSFSSDKHPEVEMLDHMVVHF